MVYSVRLFSYSTIGFLVFLCGCDQPAINKKFSFKPAPSKLYRITLIKETTQTWVYLTKQKANTFEQTDMRLSLIRSVDSLYLLKLTFENFRIDRTPALKINTQDNILLENKSPEGFNEVMNYWLRLVKEQSVYVWMNNRGIVQSITGSGVISDSVAALSKHDKKEVRYCLQDYIGEKIIRDNLNEIFSIAPSHAEKKEDSWVRDIVLINKAPVTLSNMYTIKQVKDDSVYLILNSYVSARASENATPFREGRGTGSILISYSTGIPYSYSAKSETKKTSNDNNDSTTETFSVVIR